MDSFNFFDITETTPSRSGDTTCRIFAWVGQSFESCEDCSKPYWDHMYMYPLGNNKGQFRIKKYKSWLKKWYWTPVEIITPESAEKTRAKWEGYSSWAKRNIAHG
jgi:hypothetical protein